MDVHPVKDGSRFDRGSDLLGFANDLSMILIRPDGMTLPQQQPIWGWALITFWIVPATSHPSRQASTVKLPQVLRKGMDRNNKLPLFRAENATWISWCPLWPGFTQERIRTAPKNDRKPIRNQGGSHLNWLWLFGCSGRQGLKCIMWIYTSDLRWFWGRF